MVQFVGQAEWSDEAVRREAAQYVVEALSAREPVTTWIVDDTGFLKQGTHSAGVQRQYTGSAGKSTNCQIGVSLAVATATEHAPIDFALYLPESWTKDRVRRKRARIPDNVQFRTKTELGLQMIERACLAGIPGEIILADSAYGDCCEFRETVRLLGFDYAVAVHKTTKVRRYDARGRLGPAQSIAQLVERLAARRFRKLTWRDGTKEPLASRFYFCQVKPTHDDGVPIESREAVWLVVEWPPDEDHPTKFFFTTLPRRMSKREIVRIIKERWHTERMHEDLKEELGLDHFEGRSFPGWHHHVSVALCCYAFLVAERVRAFPPEAGRPSASGALSNPASAPLRRLPGHCPNRNRPRRGSLAPTLSDLSPTTSPRRSLRSRQATVSLLQ